MILCHINGVAITTRSDQIISTQLNSNYVNSIQFITINKEKGLFSFSFSFSLTWRTGWLAKRRAEKSLRNNPVLDVESMMNLSKIVPME